MLRTFPGIRRAFDLAYLFAVLPAPDHCDLAGIWCDTARGFVSDSAARVPHSPLDHRFHGGRFRIGSRLGLDGLTR